MNRLFIMTIALCTAIIVLFSPTLADDGVFGPRFVVGDNFSLPCGLAVDETNDRVLVADTGNHCVKYAPITDLMAGPLWTTFGYVADRSAPEALNLPQGVAVDPAGNAYVVDTVSNEVQLYRYSAGSYVYDSDFARDTRTSVAGVDIDLPRDIAVGGPDNKIYLLDSGNNRVLEADGPEDTTWDVFRSGVGWGNPYGIDVDAAGNVYLADPTNSRIIKLLDGGGESPFGSYGTGAGQFRHPRDVAVSSVDGRMFVADTHNHRITRLLAGGAADDNLGMGPAFGTLQKTAADSAGRLYALDSQREHLVVYFGAGTAPGFDVYLRDYTADTGDAATPESAPLVSPDIIIRHTPDIDTAAATAAGGLSAYASQMPRYGQNNYVYLACRNRGEQEVTGVTARIYYGDPDSLMLFPADWEDSGFYMSYATSTENTPGNALFIPYIPPRTTGDGVYVAGPIIWRPPHPGGGIGGMGRFLLMAQLEHLHDLITPAPGLERVRENNNVAIIPVTVARGGIPVGEQDVLVVRVN
ncbi:MAG: hypothetical protein GY833_18775, partial [Aestuariibacter sp.]|nr:hypothetical protein [Aestuariibacter sp.]